MKKLLLALAFVPALLFAQKAPLDHSVYDGWQSIGEKTISNNGQWIAYTVTPQEGDAVLYIQSADGSFKKAIDRGYGALISADNRYLVFKIKPKYQQVREARIKKRKPEEFPKDSIGILALGTDSIIRVAKVKSFKMPEKASGWVAYHKEKETSARNVAPTQKTVDSLKKTIDSLVRLVTEIRNVKSGAADADADEEPTPGNNATEGSDLVLRNFTTASNKVFRNVADYQFHKFGRKLVMRTAKSASDSNSFNGVVVFHLQQQKADTIIRGGNDYKNFAFADDGKKLAFVGERDTVKGLPKNWGLFLYHEFEDSATQVISKHSEGMILGQTVSEHGSVSFSKSGSRLLFGTAPIQPLKDTTLVDIDLVKVDVWHYKDDYLQTQQLSNLRNEQRRSYQAVYHLADGDLQQLGSPAFPMIIPMAEGDAPFFVAVTDTGRRVQAQWQGRTHRDIYAVDVKTGEKTLIKKNFRGQVYPSATGKYILLYDPATRHYHAWNGKGLKIITKGITTPLYNEEYDMPDEPNPHGIMGWHEGDAFVYIYDKYDIWKVDPSGVRTPVRLHASGRASAVTARYQRTDEDKKYFTASDQVFVTLFNDKNKSAALGLLHMGTGRLQNLSGFTNHSYRGLQKADSASAIIFTRENFQQSPDLYLVKDYQVGFDTRALSSLNPQQAKYNWGTAELFQWKSLDGKPATGILYKPENFDASKKYPMIIYFYEKLSDNLHSYVAPAPTPSRLNIPFFVSRGYLVFTPDISYTKGHPGKDAVNYIVAGAKALALKPWVDGKNIGIQGQSWGGYQVAHLITATDMFKAAWAGAPVVNMFSAYGGIRWESGLNRQFQYEKSQSRIGATPWERRDLYIENSPFFHLPKVKTPVVIMANDADGAVPWYQGIEMFTALRRLGKPVWMLNYNGEAHNLVERKNRKDISIRQQQFFDWLLKGEKPARWLVEGVPATSKGRDWGLELADQQ